MTSKTQDPAGDVLSPQSTLNFHAEPAREVCAFAAVLQELSHKMGSRRPASEWLAKPIDAAGVGGQGRSQNETLRIKCLARAG